MLKQAEVIGQNPFARRLVGHNSIAGDLFRLVQHDRTPHALLFAGAEGVGKRLVAYAVAAEILHRSSRESSNVYRLLEAGNHPDLHPLVREEEKKDISIESIRALRSSLQLAPFVGSAAVAVINNAHQMSIAASNALLLTLEEPIAGRYLILITHAPQKLPETIVSRCQTVHFGELKPAESAQILRTLLPQGINEENLPLLLALAGNTLAPLGLGEFADDRTLHLTSQTDSGKHLAALLGRAKVLERSLSSLFSGEMVLAGDCLSLASLLSEEKGDDLTWLLLRAVARKAMREADAEKAAWFAGLLLQALDAERLVRERNANPQLQLSSLFLKAAAPS